MHQAAYEFIAEYRTFFPVNVIEIGSLNINGSVRDLFPAASWVGIDLADGPGVDVVADAVEWKPTDQQRADIVICCEVLEHTPRWRDILNNLKRWFRGPRLLLITCGGHGRMPHSAIDGGCLRPNEYYSNLGATEISGFLLKNGWRVHTARETGFDTQIVAC